MLKFVQEKRKSQANTLLAIAQARVAGFPLLRGVDDEVKGIAQLYGDRALTLTGSAATQTAFEAQAPNFAILHLAAIGDFHPAAPLLSRILLGPDDKNDGSLTVERVYGLKLTNADLVVLSACQTQIGGQSEGDDLVSLSRAFMYAGSPSVIASLWNVDDASTSLLMISFYTHLKAGMSKAQALQAAQADTRARYPNPFYWAPFVLTGDVGVADGRAGTTSSALPSSPPAAPTNLRATAVDATHVRLEWTNNATNTGGVQIFNAASTAAPIATAGPRDSSYTVSGLEPFSSYCFYVSAYNQAGLSPPSNQACADTPR